MENIKLQSANIETEVLTEQEAKEFKKLLSKFMKSYATKGSDVTDENWLKAKLKEELLEISDEETEFESIEIIKAIEGFDNNLDAINKAAEKGVSKESWIADKLQEAAVGMSINEYGETLRTIDDFLYQKNVEIHEALSRNADGHIKMSRNLDGNIAENMVAKSTELSGFLQDKNIKVEVRDVFTPNSVDVRAINLETGEYQNYQLKFGKNAQETIKLIKSGNYANQRLVVPTEQLEEVRSAFPTKTVTDHIDAWGAEGQKFTKETVKQFQEMAQEEGIMPSMDYNHYQTKDLALSIGKNAGVMALQSAAISTGLNIAYRIAQGEEIEIDEMVEIALVTGADTGIKVVSAGALQVAIRKGIISIIPKMTPAGVVANIACVGIENMKILSKIASGDLSMTRGLDQMGRVTMSMVGGLLAMGKGALTGAKLTAWIPVIGIPLSVVSGLVGGVVGYLGGTKLGDAIYSAGKKVCSTAKNVASAAWEGIKSAGRSISNGIKRGLGRIFG